MVMAEIGGHYKAHHILNHRKVVRHSLNSNLVQNGPQTLQTTNLNIKFERQSSCVGCGCQIHDQYILRVAPDLEWHAACLKCQECQQFLNENCTCFVRDGKTYCKRDYARLFGAKCDYCESSFSKNDLVMRAKNKVYHIDCFRCSACARQLHPGDEFSLNEEGFLLCKKNHNYLEKSPDSGISIEKKFNKFNYIVNSNSNHSNKSLSNNNNSSEMGSISDSESECESQKSIRENENTFASTDGKPTRVRTVLNEKQLHTLRTCYNANSRPDALMKEQLVEMTGLSPRVIRVWFQNKRCKDKKKTVEMKLQLEHEKDTKRLLNCGEIPMIASSPIRHDSPLNAYGHEITAYRPPWKTLSDFALNSNLNTDNSHTPAFQQLMYQMHGYENGNGVKQEL